MREKQKNACNSSMNRKKHTGNASLFYFIRQSQPQQYLAKGESLIELIKISNEYSIDIEKYTKIKAGDIIKSKSELRKMICYPPIPAKTANNGTMQALQNIIDMFIRCENAGGYKIRITSIEPPQIVNEIAENRLQSNKTTNSRQNYTSNRKYLLDYIILSNGINPLFLTTRKIIENSTKFQDFYYEYCAINYDRNHASKEEVQELNEFINDYEISDKHYLVEIMEILNNILYNTVFDRDNIFNWAVNRSITAEKVLYQNGNELDEETSKFLEYSYFQPLIDKGVPAKARTRQANINYMKDTETPPKKHNWFYYTYKFTKPKKFVLKIDSRELNHNQKELSGKVLAKLETEAVDPQGGNYHAQNASNFQEIMSRIR